MLDVYSCKFRAHSFGAYTRANFPIAMRRVVQEYVPSTRPLSYAEESTMAQPG